MTSFLNHRHAIWLVFALAVAARWGMAAGVNSYLTKQPERDYIIEGDAAGYWILAGKIQHGETYSIYEPPRYAMRMPGFPAVLAVSRMLFGDSLEAARYFLALLSSLAVFPGYWLGTEMRSRRAGLWAGLILALMPAYLGFSVMILSECTFATCILFNVFAIYRWMKSGETGRHEYGWALLVGLSASAAVYFRPSWILFPLLWIPFLLLWGQSSRIRQGIGILLMMTGLLAPLLPWGWRNYQVTDHFVITSLWMGPSLYDGLRPDADGDSDMTFFETDFVMQEMSEYEMNRFYREKAIVFVREHPVRTVQLAFLKLWRYWKPWPNADQFQNPFLMAVLGFSFLLFGICAVYGIWATKDRLEFVFLLTLPIVYFAGLHMIFVSSLRYRLPAEYPVAVLAGIGICALMEQRSTKLRDSDAVSE